MMPYGRCIVCCKDIEDEIDEKENHKHLGHPDSVYDKDGKLRSNWPDVRAIAKRCPECHMTRIHHIKCSKYQ